MEPGGLREALAPVRTIRGVQGGMAGRLSDNRYARAPDQRRHYCIRRLPRGRFVSGRFRLGRCRWSR